MKPFIIVSVLLALLFLSSCGESKPSDSSKEQGYATVNDEVITVAEMDYFKNRSRSDIINDYTEKYSVTDFSDFWDREFEGVTPAQSLEKRALDEAVSAKLKLVLMRENGIYEDISFKSLLDMANTFNSQNKNISGVVGLISIDIDTFYTYYIQTGEMKLLGILADGKLKPTDEEILDALETSPTATKNSLINRIVSEKYTDLISKMVLDATVQLEE